MTFWTTPKGEKLTFKEFLTRWKEGIKQATLTMPINKQNNSQIRFTWLMLIGFIAGFVISIINYKSLWWVAIVLFAAIGNTLIQIIALYQKRKAMENFKDFEEIMKENPKEENKEEKFAGIFDGGIDAITGGPIIENILTNAEVENKEMKGGEEP